MAKEIYTSEDSLSSHTGAIKKDEIVALLKTRDTVRIEQLKRRADEVRKARVGDKVHLRGIIEFSNYCDKNCLYCGLRKDNARLKRYRITPDEIFDAAVIANELGYRTVVLQSGEDGEYPADALLGAITRIKKELDLAITLSLGELTFEEYRNLKDAGADRYLLRFETSDPDLYAKLKPDGDYDKRFECLAWLKGLGYQVGSGIMTGLEGQSAESIADDILLFNDFGLDMVGNGPFIPNPDTPLGSLAGGDLLTALKVTALTRLVTQNTHIPATTAIGTIHLEGRQKALACGANVVMPNVMPRQYREHYLIYPGKICIKEDPRACGACLRNMITGLGRNVAEDHGHGLKSAVPVILPVPPVPSEVEGSEVEGSEAEGRSEATKDLDAE